MFESLRRFCCGLSRMRPCPTATIRRCSTRPLLETLEDRAVPAVFNVTSTSHTAVLLPMTAAPIEAATNKAGTGQAKQGTNVGLSFADTPLRVLSATVSGAADSATSEALRIFPLDTGFAAAAVNPLSITNPLPTAPPKLTPFPSSGGGDTQPAPSSGGDTQPIPPSGGVTQPVPPSGGGVTLLVPRSGGELTRPDETVTPAEREPGEQQEDQDLLDLTVAGLAVAFVPDSDDDVAEAPALVGVFDQPTTLSELELLLLGMVAAGSPTGLIPVFGPARNLLPRSLRMRSDI
jgi:hypothetical protein